MRSWTWLWSWSRLSVSLKIHTGSPVPDTGFMPVLDAGFCQYVILASLVRDIRFGGFQMPALMLV
jgi:hypothetical protein